MTARTVWGEVLRTFQNHVYDDVCVLYVVKVVKGLRPHFVKALEINSENIMASLYVTLFTYLVVVFFLTSATFIFIKPEKIHKKSFNKLVL